MPTYHPQHDETVATVTAMRDAAKAAVAAEEAETDVDSTSARWPHLNEVKWAAYEAAADLIPGGQSVLDDSEEQFVVLVTEVAESTDHALARKWGLPW
jgi:hypothetical protein